MSSGANPYAEAIELASSIMKTSSGPRHAFARIVALHPGDVVWAGICFRIMKQCCK